MAENESNKTALRFLEGQHRVLKTIKEGSRG